MRVHLRKGAPPTCGPPELPDRTASRTLSAHFQPTFRAPDSRTCSLLRDNCPRSRFLPRFLVAPIIPSPAKVPPKVRPEIVPAVRERNFETLPIRVVTRPRNFSRELSRSVCSPRFLNGGISHSSNVEHARDGNRGTVVDEIGLTGISVFSLREPIYSRLHFETRSTAQRSPGRSWPSYDNGFSEYTVTTPERAY